MIQEPQFALTTPSTSIQRRLRRKRCFPLARTLSEPSSNLRNCRICNREDWKVYGCMSLEEWQTLH